MFSLSHPLSHSHARLERLLFPDSFDDRTIRLSVTFLGFLKSFCWKEDREDDEGESNFALAFDESDDSTIGKIIIIIIIIVESASKWTKSQANEFVGKECVTFSSDSVFISTGPKFTI